VKPNPFRAFTEVAFILGRAGRVDLTVYDVLGREVRPIARGVSLAAGPQSLRWDGRRADGSPAAAGVYFLRLKTEAATWTRPVIRVR
jgi:flagellar hook assembly protein FlgD